MPLCGMAFPRLWCPASYRAYPRYPSPGMQRLHPLSRHGSVLDPPMQAPGIRSNIQSHPAAIYAGRTDHSLSRYPQSGVSLLYIKQLYTLPCVSRCQPPNSLHKMLIDLSTSSQHTSVRLSSPFAFGSSSLTLGTDLLTKFTLRHTARFH